MRVLLVEDDKQLSVLLSFSLQQQGYQVTPVMTPDELAIALTGDGRFSAVVLDRLLGQVDTKDFLPKIKARWPQVPVVILSAVSTPSERTDLLNMGADDYVGKPFSTQELIARLRVVQRRNTSVSSQVINLGNTTLDAVKRVATCGADSVTLPGKEFLLMKVLCEEPGRVWSRAELLETVWELQQGIETNVVEATITNLRRRLSGIGSSLQIRNMRNAGYWIEN